MRESTGCHSEVMFESIYEYYSRHAGWGGWREAGSEGSWEVGGNGNACLGPYCLSICLRVCVSVWPLAYIAPPATHAHMSPAVDYSPAGVTPTL